MVYMLYVHKTDKTTALWGLDLKHSICTLSHVRWRYYDCVFMYFHSVTKAGVHVALVNMNKLLMRLMCRSTYKKQNMCFVCGIFNEMIT